jgi:beta-galactosidase/beta-glucuronidase
VDIRGRIVRGENTVAIVIEPSSLADGLLDPLRLLGRFEVQEDGGQALVTSLRGEMLTGKSWTEQGLPYLSGTVVYDSEVDVPASLTDRMILLDCGDVGDDLEVAVNGEHVSTKLWHPYVVDVTGRLRPGRNKITIKVTNTATNLITGNKRPSGLLTVPRLRAYDLHRTTISPTRRQ